MKKILLLVTCSALFCCMLYSQQYRLVSPKQYFVTADNNVTFKWSAVDGATSYEIIVATDELFSNVSFQTTVVGLTAQTILQTGSSRAI